MSAAVGSRITAGLRTPIGTTGRSLRDVGAADLVAPLLSRLAEGTEPAEVVLGNCTGPGGDLARYAALRAGLPVHVSALTVDRQCASGLAAVVLADQQVRAGSGPVLAGGVESASTAPSRAWPDGTRYERAPFAPPELGDPDMGLAADLLAAERGVSRTAQDEYAARSHARAWSAREAGRFDDEIVPLDALRRDERPRDGLTAERLGRLPTAHRPIGEGGTVTAGNSCGINDGAAVLRVEADHGGAQPGPGLRILGSATAGVDPTRPGRGLVPAVRTALQRAEVALDDVAVVEINEAFAGQVLACCRELDLDPERVCPEGGALALGHPWGASGAVLLVRLLQQLRGGAGLGLAAIAAGGGQGVAMVVQSCR